MSALHNDEADSTACCSASEPTQKPHHAARIFAASPAEEICISGVSGQFPASRNVAEFEENLYNKVDMINDQGARWPHYHTEVPRRMGNIGDIDRFDAQFFGVNRKQAEIMDPQGRLLQERAYEAITDAGINPKALRGSRTAVYIGACFAESEKTWFYERLSERGFGITGCSRAMMANRISYALGLEGPSFLLDTACSSSAYALDAAFSAMRSGQCDAAIVGGTNLLLNPHTTIQFARLGVLAQDGQCRPFDRAASGYVRAEAVATLFLQKRRDAKRVYATLVYSKTNCDGFKVQGITYPSGRVQEQLLSEFYGDLRQDPSGVEYVEAHSTGTVVGDPEECVALDRVFCGADGGRVVRARPLLVGSVKSNIGHSESTSGVCSIVKVILAFERGAVAPNLHYKNVRDEIAGLREGRMQVCTEVTALSAADALVGVNSFGFGGANAHALLKGNGREKRNGGRPTDELPRLVHWAGRTEESVEVMMAYLSGVPLDAEYVALLHNVQSVEESAFLHRGYGLFAKAEEGGADGPARCLARAAKRFDGVRRPLVWIFSGMGSQWPEMGRAMLSVPLFRESIVRSAGILRPLGLDLFEILTATDGQLFDDIVNSFVGIAAVQIALVDILHALDQRADYLIGHSVGELGCGYADGALSAAQMLLAAYWRGRASQEAQLEPGAMAAIGLGQQYVVPLLPAGIDVACHNSSESCTVSGPAAAIRAFVAQLTARNVFAREVNCSQIAYHSRYVREIGPRLLAATRDLCPLVRRSERWLSTSVPSAQWHEPEAQFSGAQYYVNNLLNAVLFEETVARVPETAIVVEIAPHGLLQAIVRRSLPRAVHVPLTQRGSPTAAFFLEALGKLYVNGCSAMPLQRLYPAVEWPVSRGTAKISPLLRWDHADSYFVTKFDVLRPAETGEMRVKVNLGVSEYAYVAGHNIDGRCLFPATGYLELIWITFARQRGAVHHLLPVEFEDVVFLRATALQPHADIELTVMVHYGSGAFEVSEAPNTSICTGRVRALAATERPVELPPLETAPYPDLTGGEFYKELRLRGYQYRDAFQAVERARSDGQWGRIRWDSNWVAFMDCMLQMAIVTRDTRALLLPTRVQKVRIFPQEHMARMHQHRGAEAASSSSSSAQPMQMLCDVQLSRELNVIQAGGVEIHGLVTNAVSRRKAAGDLVLEAYRFVPYMMRDERLDDLVDATRVCVQIVLENLRTDDAGDSNVLRAVEVLHAGNVEPLMFTVDEVLAGIPLIVGKLTVLSDQPIDARHHAIRVGNERLSAQTNCQLVIGTPDGLNEDLFGQNYPASASILIEDGFAIVRLIGDHHGSNDFDDTALRGFQVIASVPCDKERLILLRKIRTPLPTTTGHKIIDISATSKTEPNNYEWLHEFRCPTDKPILLVAQRDPDSGIVGLVNCMRREPDTKYVKCVFLVDADAPRFDENSAFFAEQLQRDVTMNVLKNGVWGSYRHLRLRQPKQLLSANSHCYANVRRNGDLTSFAWLQGPLRLSAANTHSPTAQHAADDLVRVHFASINFRDVMLATGRLTSEIINSPAKTATTQQQQQRLHGEDCVLGLEYAGTAIPSGRRVMGMVAGGAMATLVRAQSPLVWTVPNEWSLRQAATVPVVYVTVYCAFFLGKVIAAGKSILIHAGSGGVGMAAIRVALAYGLEVFTTVSSVQKRRYVLEQFAQLKESNIGNSRDCSFERMVMMRTGGSGVDYVLNSLSDEKLLASVRCLGRGGVFLEIGKFDLANDTKLGLGVFLKEMSFRSVLADNLLLPSADEALFIHALIERDLRAGVIQPLDATVFQVDEIEKAYRYLGTGQHVGKVLIRVVPNSEASKDQPAGGDAVVGASVAAMPTPAIAVRPRAYFDADKVYVVPGGLGGFGLELTDWMIMRGARRVLLSSSRGISTKYQVYRMRIWQNYGCNIHVSTADIRTARGCRELLTQAGHLGVVDGIFNLAVCLRDALLVNQTAQTFGACMAPKADATRHLDAAARQMGLRLSYFVCFSSVSGGRGNAGQSNYGMANACMERIVERRVADGLAGKAIQWGAVGEVGLVARMLDVGRDAAATHGTDDMMEIAGTLQQRIGSCLTELDVLLTGGEPVVASMVVAKKCRTAVADKADARIAATTVLERVLHIMCIRNMNSISMSTSLSELGMDSLMTVEIKQTLEREFDIALTTAELRALTFLRLEELSSLGGQKKPPSSSLLAASAKKSRPTMIFDIGALLSAEANVASGKTGGERMYALSGDGAEARNERVWIVMPGVEGDNRTVWRTIAECTKGITFIVRYDEAAKEQSVLVLARIYANDIRERFPQRRHFAIIAYSFGTTIAIEVARLLEADGRHGHIVCIDGAPTFLRRLVFSYVGGQQPTDVVEAFSAARLENRIARELINFYAPESDAMLSEASFDQLDGWQQKIETVIAQTRRVRGANFDATLLRTFATGLYRRAVATMEYTTAIGSIDRIRAAVTLVRAADATFDDIDEHYDLARYTAGTLDLKIVAGNHQTILQAACLPDIINGVEVF